MLTEDVEISFEIDDVVVEAAGELILNAMTVVFALAWDIVGSLDEAAGSELDLYTTIKIEDIVDSIIVVADYCNCPDDKILVLGD